MHITKTRAEKRLEQAKRDLELLESRLAVAHSLGDTNRAQGIEAVFNENPFWSRKRDQLRRQVEFWEDYLAHLEDPGSNPLPSAPSGVVYANYYPSY